MEDMGKQAGKKKVFSFFSRKLRSARRTELQPLMAPAPIGVAGEGPTVQAGAKGAKKKAGSRLWMRFDRTGQSEVAELDKNAIIRRASIPTRDLRILGPIFSHSSNIIDLDSSYRLGFQHNAQNFMEDQRFWILCSC
ncbi:Magnesium transporter MRS2-4 [Dendrobium catenatum]|uniref:Magnesium transporter MRS2-4 n=1 Tax=Dendrobium catenatum TaxID=906689 RepID=A0A2I0VMG8_9ASPA|nr:Magnesium transporter MRS2-4 [Dendrobium catenatum]